MAHVQVTPSGARWSVRAGGAVLAQSSRALELREGSYPPVIYFPREDVAMPLFERSATSSRCPHKGLASYFSFMGKSGPIADVAWSYEEPIEGDVRAIAGHLAFYPGKVTLERV